MIRVKICGVRRMEDMEAAAKAGADAVGLVVGFPDSPRNLSPDEAKVIRRQAPPFLDIVLVTGGGRLALEDLCSTVEPDAIQVYSDVEPEFLRELGVKWVIKPVDVGEGVEVYAEGYDALLLDSGRGGTGRTHDWSLSRRIRDSVKIPVILAGGLTPDNVAEAIRAVKPYGVDVSSGVESAPGIKDHRKIASFIRRAKAIAYEV